MNKDRFYTYAALGLMLVVAIMLVVDTFRSRKPVPAIVQRDEKPAAVTIES